MARGGGGRRVAAEGSEGSAKGRGRGRGAEKKREQLLGELLSKCTSFADNSGASAIDEHKELTLLTNKLCELEKELVIPFPDRKSHFEEFKVWCNENGVDDSKVSIVAVDLSNEEYGLRANVQVSESDLLLTIPRKLMMTTETAIKDVTLGEFIAKDPVLQTMPNVLLALHVMSEYCKKDSFWKPYLATFPSKYRTPLFMSHEDIKRMKGSPVLEEAVKLCRSIGRQYAYFWKQMNSNTSPASRLPFKRHFTFEFYRWAVSTVMTRQNFIPSADGSKRINALIPFWDMSNHVNGKYSTDYCLEKDSALCYAMKQFDAEDEIKIFYGLRSNGEFVLHNGFVYPENENDYLPIKLGISRNDSSFAAKKEICTRAGLLTSDVYKLFPKSKPVDGNLLAFLRIFHMTKGEAENWLKEETVESVSDLKNQENVSFQETDGKVDLFLRTRVTLLLKAYPDEEVEGKGPEIEASLSSGLILCEKKILESYLI